MCVCVCICRHCTIPTITYTFHAIHTDTLDALFVCVCVPLAFLFGRLRTPGPVSGLTPSPTFLLPSLMHTHRVSPLQPVSCVEHHHHRATRTCINICHKSSIVDYAAALQFTHCFSGGGADVCTCSAVVVGRSLLPLLYAICGALRKFKWDALGHCNKLNAEHMRVVQNTGTQVFARHFRHVVCMRVLI